MYIENVREAATRFRKAIELCAPSLGISFSAFPKGSCGDATPLLGTYLIELGFGSFQYMLGSRGSQHNGSWFSHAWLQSDLLAVDITADQFPEVEEKIIVTEHSDWHEQFHGEAQHVADFRIYDQFTRSVLAGIYQKINEAINKL